jgi:hypothetical protein
VTIFVELHPAVEVKTTIARRSVPTRVRWIKGPASFGSLDRCIGTSPLGE